MSSRIPGEKASLRIPMTPSRGVGEVDAGLLRLAAFVCNTSDASLFLQDVGRCRTGSLVALHGRIDPFDEAFCERVAYADGVIILQDAERPGVTTGGSSLGTCLRRCCAGTPIISSDGSALGSLCVFDWSPKELSSEQAEALPDRSFIGWKDGERLTQCATAFVEVYKEQSQVYRGGLKASASTDPLTGAPGHRAFHLLLDREAGRALQDGTTLSVAALYLGGSGLFNDLYGHATGDAVLRQAAERLAVVCAAARFGGDELTLLFPVTDPDPTPAAIEADIRAVLGGLAHRPVGEPTAVPIACLVGAALLPPGGMFGEVVRSAEERMRRVKTGGGNGIEADHVRASVLLCIESFSMLDALVTAVDNKDRYTRRHSEDVLDYSLVVARGLGLDEKTQHTVTVAALLHEVGKIGVPDSILRKPGRLTDNEFEAVKQHPMMGALLIQAGLGRHARRCPPPPRALRRRGLPVRAARRGVSPNGAADGRRRRLQRHDRGQAVPGGYEPGEGEISSGRRGRLAVRPLLCRGVPGGCS